jgi:class 3 adenylate cyclase
MNEALARHDAVVRAAIAHHGGYVFSTAGDSFAAAFTTPLLAVSAAIDAQRLLADVGCGCGWQFTWVRPTSGTVITSVRQ